VFWLNVCVKFFHSLVYRKLSWSIIQNDEETQGDANHWIQARWLKLRSASSVLCDAKVPLKLKEIFYQTSIWPTMMCEIDFWLVKNQQEHKVNIAETRMLRWFYGKTRWDELEMTRLKRVEAPSIIKKMVETRLRWFEYLTSRFYSKDSWSYGGKSD